MTPTYKQKNNIKHSTRLIFIVNRHRVNNKLNCRTKPEPGNSSCKNVVKFRKNTFILGTSILTKTKEFNQHLKN